MTAPTGWTGRLEFAPYNALTNGYRVPGRGASPATSLFQSTNGELYFYAVEITPTYDRGGLVGPDRMAPLVDDVQVVYIPWDTALVIEEVELVD